MTAANTLLAAAAWVVLTITPSLALAQHQHGTPAPAKPADDPHAGHVMPEPPAEQPLPPFIPPITDADRAAAFPDVAGHTVHDEALHSFVLFDQFEWQVGDDSSGVSWDTKAWVGQDVHRFWFRSEGETEDGHWEHAEGHFLYGRALSRWWDVVAGVRQDIRPSPAQAWAAIGIQGLAPYWFEVEATAYVGAGGRTQFRVETEYELLLTNRLMLQPMMEFDIFGKADPERRIGAGLSEIEAGLRLRYEIRREFAPYVGLTWHRKFFGTAEMIEADGESPRDSRLVTGIRIWF